jgi:hypothetical protein
MSWRLHRGSSPVSPQRACKIPAAEQSCQAILIQLASYVNIDSHHDGHIGVTKVTSNHCQGQSRATPNRHRSIWICLHE